MDEGRKSSDGELIDDCLSCVSVVCMSIVCQFK